MWGAKPAEYPEPELLEPGDVRAVRVECPCGWVLYVRVRHYAETPTRCLYCYRTGKLPK